MNNQMAHLEELEHFLGAPSRLMFLAIDAAREQLDMTRRCELTGKLPLSGQNRSHAENKSKRKFRPNLCKVSLMSETLGRVFKMRVSAHALRTVEHRGGLDAFLMKANDDTLSDRCLKIKNDVKKARAETTEASPAA